MRILIKKAQLFSPRSAHHLRCQDVLIDQGRIADIADTIQSPADEVVNSPNLWLSDGWVDMRSHAKDPGYEHKETLEQLSRAAAAGGFTELLLLPNTLPVRQSKEAVQFLQHRSANQAVQLHPSVAITLQAEGQNFTEMRDLHEAGAVAFTDGERPLQHADLLLKTLQYLSPFGGLLINRPEDDQLGHFGQMHEGIHSTYLGMKGIPALAEEMMVLRDLKLLEYSDIQSDRSVLHLTCLSTKQAVEWIRKAKKQGLPVSCDVAIHQLLLDDSALVSFDTNLKVSPPLRSNEHLEALWEGLADGTIDAIVSDHNAQDEESKMLEFDLAEPGITSLETLFGLWGTTEKSLDLTSFLDKITRAPRHILRLPQPKIEVGEPANCTLFDPDIAWKLSPQSAWTSARNTPFFGKNLRGKVLGIVHNGRWVAAPQLLY
jgi:dihydroorotase